MPKRKTPLDEFTKLLENPSHDLFIEVYTKSEGRHKPVTKPGNKLTLADLAVTIKGLAEKIDSLNNKVDTGFRQVNDRIDQIETRIDGIDARLDYNGLKKLPKNK